MTAIDFYGKCEALGIDPESYLSAVKKENDYLDSFMPDLDEEHYAEYKDFMTHDELVAIIRWDNLHKCYPQYFTWDGAVDDRQAKGANSGFWLNVGRKPVRRSTSITGDRFVLMRTESATQELALKFSQEFRKYEAAVFGKFEYDVWLEECAAAEVPLGLHEQIEVNRRVKDQLDIWLADNAERFGYRYERVSRRGRGTSWPIFRNTSGSAGLMGIL